MFSYEVEGLTELEKITLIRTYLHEIETSQTWIEDNKGKPWTDEELKVVLSFAPTKENILKVAKEIGWRALT